MKILSYILLALAILPRTAEAARCENFSSNINVHNQFICPFLKAGISAESACKQVGPARCVSRCNDFSNSSEDCKMNEACIWIQDTLVNPCREKSDGWIPQFKR